MSSGWPADRQIIHLDDEIPHRSRSPRYEQSVQIIGTSGTTKMEEAALSSERRMRVAGTPPGHQGGQDGQRVEGGAGEGFEEARDVAILLRQRRGGRERNEGWGERESGFD